MRTSLLSILALAALSGTGSAANTGDYFFGYWQWHSVVDPNDQTPYDNPQDACRAAVAQLGVIKGDPDPTFIDIVKASDFTFTNDYLCEMKLNGTTQILDDISANYLCPPNASSRPLTNSGLFSDERCYCNAGPCHSSAPPSFDTSQRCVSDRSLKQESTDDTLSLDTTPNWIKLFNRFKLDYAEAIADMPDPKECHFSADQMWSNPDQATVNLGYLCGFRDGDEYAANAIARKSGDPGPFASGTPEGYTWHHDLMNMGELKLVKTEAHKACSHDGGGAAWARMFGWTSYPTHLPTLTPAP